MVDEHDPAGLVGYLVAAGTGLLGLAALAAKFWWDNSKRRVDAKATVRREDAQQFIDARWADLTQRLEEEIKEVRAQMTHHFKKRWEAEQKIETLQKQHAECESRSEALEARVRELEGKQ